MTRTRITLAAVLAAIFVQGCGDENGGAGPDPSWLLVNEIVGTWEATAMEFANNEAPSQKVDLIDLGGAVTVKFDSKRRIAVVTRMDDEIQGATASFTLSGHTITVTGHGQQQSEAYSCELVDDTMTLTNVFDGFDFDGDGAEESATLTLILVSTEDTASIVELAGAWEMSRWEIVNDADPTQTVDLIALGGTATVTIDSDGGYALVARAPDGSEETVVGTLWTVSEYVVAFDEADPANPAAFACDMQGETMILTSTSGAYDFDGDGIDEQASQTQEWRRI